ncbi:UNVERIFIED_CONTAM: hypothetical protein Slati_1070800 [Sesamum latifolium]|uniref:Retrotransposon Copia-like N-terminal domain-containing protein n=1 Tax=Sesamum latifolium TaxID=2727402 RepID=A0AAW2XYT4_9LAMI
MGLKKRSESKLKLAKGLPAASFLSLLSKLALFSLAPSPPCGGSVEVLNDDGDAISATPIHLDSLHLKVSAYRTHSRSSAVLSSVYMAANPPAQQTETASSGSSRTDVEISQSTENSGLVLVSSPLTGDNYLVWSRAVKFALGAKKRLSFIDGRSVRPAENSEELDEWIRIDYMIITWILNSVSKRIVDASSMLPQQDTYG